MMHTEFLPDEARGLESIESTEQPVCRSCGTALGTPVLDLGLQPLSNAYLRAEQLHQAESVYPLQLRLCSECSLVQADAVIDREEIFHSGYQYFSSYSDSWLAHAKEYAEHIIAARKLDQDSFIVEVASNDGYLLRWFAEKGLRVQGIDPARDCALAAEKVGVPTMVAFFGLATATAMVAQHGQANLLIGNNVLAHVPDLNDFVAGVAVLLTQNGVATFEFPHLLELIRKDAYDTIYHEHYSYLSLIAVMPLFARHGLRITNVERIPTHGGSLRIYVEHIVGSEPQKTVAHMLVEEYKAEIHRAWSLQNLAEAIDSSRLAIQELIFSARRDGAKIAAYGAAAKGNTLLNTLGIGAGWIDFVVDRNQHKIGYYLPGSHIPIVDIPTLQQEKPTTIFILPWNLCDEIIPSLAFTREWGAKIYRCIPELLEV